MHLIAPLAAGVFGAANGTAQIYQRGSGTRASWYSDFEGRQVFGSGADIDLDGNGGAAVYVNEIVDVVVVDVNGAVVRQFTAGESAPAVEVRSLSFSGTDYDTAQNAAGNPTTLQAVLDLWKVSAGTTDFKVLAGGVATTLQNIVQSVVFFNVKDAQYGAKGDSATNDHTAIQAAIDAAHTAGGGIVYFPPGTYRLTSALTLYRDVSLLGSGSLVCTIAMDHASNNMFTANGGSSNVATYVMGLKFNHQQACTGVLFDLTPVAYELVTIACVYGGGSNTRGLAFSGGSGSVVHAHSCRFDTRAAMVLMATGFYATDCVFVLESVAAATLTMVKIQGYGFLQGCHFFPAGATASTITVVAFDTSAYGSITNSTFNVFGATTTGHCVDVGSGAHAAVSGCQFAGIGSATTAIGFYLNAADGSLSESGNVWSSNGATLGKPGMTPYFYTASTNLACMHQLASREGFADAVTQTGGGTKTVSTDLYSHVSVDIQDNTGFTLQLTKAPVGARCTVDLLASGGAGSGAIAWGAAVYGNPSGGFTVATTKHRMYGFRSVLVGGTIFWMLQGSSFGDM